jgi:hypothetical protein
MGRTICGITGADNLAPGVDRHRATAAASKRAQVGHPVCLSQTNG